MKSNAKVEVLLQSEEPSFSQSAADRIELWLPVLGRELRNTGLRMLSPVQEEEEEEEMAKMNMTE
jgi:hypothetical protein